MPRIRTVKPELLDHAPFATLGDEAQLLYYKLLGMVDDAGRAVADVRSLHARAFWGRPRSIRRVAAALAELERVGFVALYEANGSQFLEIRGWAEQGSLTHQRIEHKQPSPLPAPSSVSSTNVPRVIHGDSSPNQNQDQNREREREREGERTGRRAGSGPQPEECSLPASDLAGPHARAPEDPELQRRQKLRAKLWDAFEAMRQRVAGKLRVEVRPLPAQDPGQRELANRIVEAGDLDRARAEFDRAIEVLEAEAIAKGTMRWLDGQVFRADRYGRAVGMAVEDAKRSKPADGYEAPTVRVGHGVTDDGYADTRGGLPWGDPECTEKPEWWDESERGPWERPA